MTHCKFSNCVFGNVGYVVVVVVLFLEMYCIKICLFKLACDFWLGMEGRSTRS